MHNRFKTFFSTLLLTTALPYIPFIIPFIPGQIFGFNLTGWAWIIMLLITLINSIQTRSIGFPYIFWLPWISYIVVYIITDYSFIGLQLTLQYSLPLMIGIVASGISYTSEDLEWLFSWFMKLCISVYAMFLIGFFFRGGYGPAVAATPMLFSISACILAALWFITRKKKYLMYIGILFLVPVLEVTRMGIAAMAAAVIFHFSNHNLRNKIVFGILGALVLLIVFNSTRFQEKTFKSGEGELSDITVNYYENQEINSSGRSSWKKALQPGLNAAPIWGNGPRADNFYLTKITGLKSGEAHNDYLSVRFNYGYVGLALLLSGFLTTFVSLYRISRKYIASDYIWLLSTSALTLFFSFLMFMYTDNILKYTIYFPNYFFALIGIVYSLKRDEDFGCYTPL